MRRDIRKDMNERTHHLPHGTFKYKKYNTEQKKEYNDAVTYVIERRCKREHGEGIWLCGFVRWPEFIKTCLPGYCLPHDPHKGNRECEEVGENAPNNSPPY